MALLPLLGWAAEADAVRSPWVRAERSQMRLLASAPSGDARQGGIEIVLEPGWHTYWRNPGEAGVPPVFDFAGSENLGSVEVLYPAPERFDDGTSVSLVYKDEVVFPIAVSPADPSRPIRLDLKATFGVCREICIPTRAQAHLTIAVEDEADPLADARLKLYRARVPGPPVLGVFDIEEVRPEADMLVVNVRTPETDYLDLFVEPPPNWYLGQPSFVSRLGQISTFELPLRGRPPGAEPQGQTFRFVAVAGAKAIEELIIVR